MICDCHLHTCFSGDSETPVRAQLDRAISLGMQAVCITDHHDWDAPNEKGEMDDRFLLDFPRYIPALREIREEYRGRLDMGIGVELGLQLHARQDTENVMKLYGDAFDFIIGSIHFVDHYDVYYPQWFAMDVSESRSDERYIHASRRSRVDAMDVSESRSDERYIHASRHIPSREEAEAVTPEKEAARYRHFFEVTLKRLEAYDCFDTLGHLDFVVRYGPNRNQFYDFKTYGDIISAILELLIRKDKALEVNTGGFKYGLGHPNPCEDVLKRYRELGGRLLTVGSDAHVPGFVGYEFDRTAELLKEIGFREYALYRKRVPQMLPL